MLEVDFNSPTKMMVTGIEKTIIWTLKWNSVNTDTTGSCKSVSIIWMSVLNMGHSQDERYRLMFCGHED